MGWQHAQRDRGTALAVLAAVGRLGSTAAQLYNSLLIGLALPVSLLLLTSAATMLCASVLAALLPRETARAALDDTCATAADDSGTELE